MTKTASKKVKADKKEVFISFKGDALEWLEERRQRLGFNNLQEILHDLVRQTRIAETAANN